MMLVPAVRRRFSVRYNSSSLWCRLHIQCGGPFHRTRGRQSLPSRTRRRQQQQGGRRRRRRRRRRSVERRRLSRMSQRRSHRFVFASVLCYKCEELEEELEEEEGKRRENEERLRKYRAQCIDSIQVFFPLFLRLSSFFFNAFARSRRWSTVSLSNFTPSKCSLHARRMTSR